MDNTLKLRVLDATEILTHNVINDLCTNRFKVDGRVTIHHGSDVALLFQQKDLEKRLGRSVIDELQSRLDRSLSSSSSVSGVDLRQVSDSDKFAFIKSRYIQQPSDLIRYSRYLNYCASKMLQVDQPAKPVKQHVEPPKAE